MTGGKSLRKSWNAEDIERALRNEPKQEKQPSEKKKENEDKRSLGKELY